MDPRFDGTPRLPPFSLVSGPSHYDVLRLLASGGMGSVYLARRTGIGGFARHVALKTTHPRFAASLFHEARILARLGHRNVVQAYDFGQAHDGLHFLAMELVHGHNVLTMLERAAERRSSIPLSTSLSIALGAATGLAHAHDLCDDAGELVGLVHRDVTPSNLLLAYDGAVKLADFGVATLSRPDPRQPRGPVKARLGYLSPEQIEQHGIDHRSDLFSLGVVLYELCTLRRAFPGNPRRPPTAPHLRGLPVPPARLIPRFPARVEDIVMTALHPDPAARFQSAHALRDAIVAAADELGVPIGDAAVARTMCAMFGTPPEPWLALPDRGGDAVTGRGPFGALDYITLEADLDERAAP